MLSKLKVLHAAMFYSALIGTSVSFAATDSTYTHANKHSQANSTNKSSKHVVKVDETIPISMDHCPQAEKLTLFYQTVNQNSPMSYANNHFCLNDMLSLSGRTSMDLRWYDRYGSAPIGSLWGVGLRPLFGKRVSQWWASLNQASLFVDAKVNNWLMADMSLTYANASVKSRTFAHELSDWRSVYGPAAALKVDEAYLTFARPEKFPFYVRVGRQYSIFGDYKPYPITESLTQILEQSRTGAFVAGMVLENGLYGSLSWSLSKQSLQDLNVPAGNEAAVFTYKTNNLDRNYGAKLGYQVNACLAEQDFHLNANVSWLADIRDVDYLNELWFFVNVDASNPQVNLVLAGQEFYMNRQGGLAAHLDSSWGIFGVGADYVTALGDLFITQENSRIYSWGVNANLSFMLPVNLFDQCGMPSVFDLSYQGSGNAYAGALIVYNPFLFNQAVQILSPQGIELPLVLGNALPKRRWVGTYTVDVMKNVSVSAQWVHDIDYSTKEHGTGLSANLGVLNITANF